MEESHSTLTPGLACMCVSHVLTLFAPKYDNDKIDPPPPSDAAAVVISGTAPRDKAIRE